MNVADLDHPGIGEIVQTDLCIIGSGPAGLTLAREFFGTSIQILIVETGLAAHAPEIDALSQIESVGAPRIMDQTLVRNRVFGGTSHTWSGRCTPLSAIDFAARPWVPYSGWPIAQDELQPYVERSCAFLRLAPKLDYQRVKELPRSATRNVSLDTSLLEESFWQYSSDAKLAHDYMRFGPHFLAETAPNVRVLLNATATELIPDETGSRIAAVRIASANGRRASIQAKSVVLCAGGIENARIMLLSQSHSPSGIGNEHGTVGQFLMDHPRCTLGVFAASDVAAITKHYGLFRTAGPGGGHAFSRGVRLSDVAQERMQLLNCAAWLTEDRAADDPWAAAKRLIGRKDPSWARDAAIVLSHPGLIAQGLKDRVLSGRGVPHKLNQLKLDCIVEQRPDPASRLTLGQRKDRMGLPVARLDWRISDQEKQTVMQFGTLIASEFARVGLPVPALTDWVREQQLQDANFVDVSHPIGTTRMSDDPRFGVVDRDCQVHGMLGLFVAGSSVFPTTGHANPTQMIVTLAIRLADHLKRREFALPNVA
jgi:choline dehydrogenase-like flavoprotein